MSLLKCQSLCLCLINWTFLFFGTTFETLDLNTVKSFIQNVTLKNFFCLMKLKVMPFAITWAENWPLLTKQVQMPEHNKVGLKIQVLDRFKSNGTSFWLETLASVLANETAWLMRSQCRRKRHHFPILFIDKTSKTEVKLSFNDFSHLCMTNPVASRFFPPFFLRWEWLCYFSTSLQH